MDSSAAGVQPADGPLGADPIAWIIYDPRGHVAAQLMARDRTKPAATTPTVSPPDPNNSAASGGYDAYFGTTVPRLPEMDGPSRWRRAWLCDHAAPQVRPIPIAARMRHPHFFMTTGRRRDTLALPSPEGVVGPTPLHAKGEHARRLMRRSSYTSRSRRRSDRCLPSCCRSAPQREVQDSIHSRRESSRRSSRSSRAPHRAGAARECLV
jgi:hypothetical protein